MATESRSGLITRSSDGNAPKAGKSFGRLAVKMFVVSLRLLGGVVDNAISVLGRCVDCVELEWNASRVDDVVLRSSRDDDRGTGFYGGPRTINNRFPRSFLYTKKLIEFVNFRPVLFLGLLRQ
jgi:hypothetical protein